MPEASSPATSADAGAKVAPRVLSGIQPTADSFHLGNYLGALRQWVAMQDTHDAFYCVVDLHAITVEHDPATLRRRTKVAVAQLLAMGLDPDRATVFVQSHVPEHAELAWVLGCLTGFGEAGRMTQFKDKSSKQGTSGTTVGLFTYPILQAADILLYQAERCPRGRGPAAAPGADPHAGAAFQPPFRGDVRPAGAVHPLRRREDHRPAGAGREDEQVRLLPAGDHRRAGGARPDAQEDHARGHRHRHRGRVRRGEEGRRHNLLRIYSALEGTPIPDLERRYEGSGYGQFKKDLAQIVVDTFTPIRERTQKLLDDEAHLDRLLAHGADRATRVAGRTMETVRERVGFVGRGH